MEDRKLKGFLEAERESIQRMNWGHAYMIRRWLDEVEEKDDKNTLRILRAITAIIKEQHR